MRTVFYIDGKKIAKKELEGKIGKERLKGYISYAKERFMIDPLEQQSWFIGYGMLTIEFK